MGKFKFEGSLRVDFIIEVNAEDQSDAEDMVESISSANVKGISFANIDESDITAMTFDVSNIDIEIDMAQEKWGQTDKSERISIMKDNGASDDCAYELAGRDDIPDDFSEYFSV